MTIKTNIGLLNAFLRITLGLTILSWSTAKLVKKPWCNSTLFIALMGAMKVAEGIVRYCPVTDMFNECQERVQENQENAQNETTFQEQIPYNPT